MRAVLERKGKQMATKKGSRTYVWDFRGYNAIPTTGTNVGTPWCKKDTSSAGTPVWQVQSGGALRIGFDNTSEIQIQTLYFGDVLAFDIDELLKFWINLRAGQTFDSASQVAFGLAGSQNDAIDSIAQAALFRCIANNTVVVESDDGTNDNNLKATGLSLSSSNYGRFLIDFGTGSTVNEPPDVSTGRPSNIEFYGPNTYGSKRRVASGTRFDMSNYTGGLQPFVQLQKTADTNTDYIEILEVGVEVNLPDYAA